jgi:hypothetical protein
VRSSLDEVVGAASVATQWLAANVHWLAKRHFQRIRRYAIDVHTPLAHHAYMIFIETRVFTRQVAELLDDDEYAEFQMRLQGAPLSGDVIEGTGGLRKIRVAAKGRGKRGGARVIYFHVSSDQQIRLLLIYAKGVKDDLNAQEKSILRKLNEEW